MDGFIDGGVMDNILLGALALLGFFLVTGMAWGLKRGFKRSSLRLVTLVIGLVLALLLTPLMSKMLVNMPLPFFGGKSVGAFLHEKLPPILADNGVGDIIIGSASAVLNLILYFVMYFVFKMISWIVYAVLAKTLCPTDRRTRAEKKSHAENPNRVTWGSRWAGLGMGALTGLVLFGFFAIPVSGLMKGLDEIADAKSTFGGYTVQVRKDLARQASGLQPEGFQQIARVSEEGEEKPTEKNSFAQMAKIQHDVIEFNNTLQSSAVGRITSITGMQWLGRLGMMYLGQGDKGINLYTDTIRLGQIANNSVAIAGDLMRDGEGNQMARIGSWTEKDYKMLQDIVNNVFQITFVKVAFNSSEGFIESLKKEGTLDGTFEGIPHGDETDKTEMVAAGYGAVLEISKIDSMRHDLISLIELARILGAQNPETHKALWEYLKDVFTNFNNPAIIDEKIAELRDPAKGNIGTWQKGSRLRDLTDTLFNMNVIKKVFEKDELKILYTAPLAKNLKISEEDAVITNSTESFSETIAKIINSLIDVLGDVSYLANDVYKEDGETKLELTEKIVNINVEHISNILDELTNGDNQTIVRALIMQYLPYDEEQDGDSTDPMKVVLKQVYGFINEGKDIPWKSILTTIQSAVNLYNVINDVFSDISSMDFTHPENNIEDIMDVFDALIGLMDAATDDPLLEQMLADIVGGILEGVDYDMGNLGTQLDNLAGVGGTIDNLVAQNPEHADELNEIKDKLDTNKINTIKNILNI